MTAYQLGFLIYVVCTFIGLGSLALAAFSKRNATPMLANAVFWFIAPWLILIVTSII